jgi:hypothetical protein|tara:strand:- start:625 stop:1080 length:456 start_codon:yes stop_codon:yes gene_type:complete
MSIADWGKATWTLFHTLAEKLKENEINHVPVLLKEIINICHHLPCPTCREHAIATIKSCNKSLITNKEQLIIFLWQFHNKVNVKKKRNRMKLEDCQKLYKLAKTGNVIQYFLNIFSLNSKNEKGMMDTFHRAKCIERFKKYILQNHLKFNH